MPITKSAIKKQRVDKRRTDVNRGVRSAVKSAVKRVKADGNVENVRNMYSALDRAVKDKVLPKNRAARVKARVLAELKGKGAKSMFGKKAAKKTAEKKTATKKSK